MIVNSAIYTSSFLALTLWSYDVLGAQPPPYAPDLAGDYCRARSTNQCCRNRQDDCSAPILGTLCYCDDFCIREGNGDCCPDFWTFCKNIPANISQGQCERNGRFYNVDETLKSNCKSCKCQMVNNQFEILCEDKLCLLDEGLIERVNGNYRTYGWRASNYSSFWGRYYEEGLTYRLGTIHSKKKAAQMLPLNPNFDRSSLRRVFDARIEWPDKISRPKDQGWCGASWAFSTVAVASDRFAITLGRLLKQPNRLHYVVRNKTFYLSPQHLVSCNSRQRGCQGGYLIRAWNYVRKFGLVPESCYPWENSARLECRIKKFSALTEASCPNVSSQGRDNSSKSDLLHRVGPAYRLSGEEDIMHEIMESGPVQATIKISRDFFAYRTGIYRCLGISQNYRSAFHSVRIVGWGEEFQNNGMVKYWIVSNTWGEWWGERGYFRIRRGVNECQIEEFVLAAWANIESLSRETKDELQPPLEYDIMPDINNQI